MTRPHIGQVVSFWSRETTGCLDHRQPFHAVIVYVSGTTSVHLRVTDHTGTPFIVHNVLLRAPSSGDAHGLLHAMPPRYATFPVINITRTAESPHGTSAA